jgi:hypothetical protein
MPTWSYKYNTSTRLCKTDNEPEIGHSNKKKFKFQPNFMYPALINTDLSEHDTNLGDFVRLLFLSIACLYWLSD